MCYTEREPNIGGRERSERSEEAKHKDTEKDRKAARTQERDKERREQSGGDGAPREIVSEPLERVYVEIRVLPLPLPGSFCP